MMSIKEERESTHAVADAADSDLATQGQITVGRNLHNHRAPTKAEIVGQMCL
jgi:hypothetical protein